MKENTRKAITIPQRHPMPNSSPSQNLISSHSNPLYNINNLNNAKDKHMQQNPGIQIPQNSGTQIQQNPGTLSPNTSSSSTSSIKKLFKSFGADVRNKLSKKSKSGHQLLKNEPG